MNISPLARARQASVRLRIDFSPGRALGPGKVGLLEAVTRTGSLTAAAAECGMSYKRAWTLLHSVNQLFGRPLVLLAKGGQGGGGARVTALGHDIVAAYRSAESRAARAVSTAFGKVAIAPGRRSTRPAVKRLSGPTRSRRRAKRSGTRT